MRIFGCVLISVCLIFSMVVSTCGGGSGSSSGVGTELVNERMQEFISLEITHGILEQNPVIFSSIKEGIMEVM